MVHSKGMQELSTQNFYHLAKKLGGTVYSQSLTRYDYPLHQFVTLANYIYISFLIFYSRAPSSAPLSLASSLT